MSAICRLPLACLVAAVQLGALIALWWTRRSRQCLSIRSNNLSRRLPLWMRILHRWWIEMWRRRRLLSMRRQRRFKSLTWCSLMRRLAGNSASSTSLKKPVHCSLQRAKSWSPAAKVPNKDSKHKILPPNILPILTSYFARRSTTPINTDNRRLGKLKTEPWSDNLSR